MRVAVVGQGHVGLTGAVALAQHGHRVVGVEKDATRLMLLRAGEPTVVETGLAEQMAAVFRAGRLQFTDCLEEAVAADPVDAVLICVGTPPSRDGGPDLTQVYQVFEEAAGLDGNPLIVLKSTVPPGTTDALLAARPDLRDRFVCNPDFLVQGTALDDWRAPTRTVVGSRSPHALERLRTLYAWSSSSWVTTSPSSAEMVKYASNAFLAMRISYANELARLCGDPDLDVDAVITGVGLDPRIGRALPGPGPGFGDSDLAKDTLALAVWARARAIDTPLLDAAIEIDVRQTGTIMELVRTGAGGRLSGLSVAVLGLRHEPWSDDLRAAPSRALIPLLHEHEADVRVWDPAMTPEELRSLAPRALPCTALVPAVTGAHAVVVLTPWPQLAEADWDDLATRMKAPRLLVDARNHLPTRLLARWPGVYRSVGNRHPAPQVSEPEPTS
ncbi:MULTISPECIES: UDP-glucose dehydrogenase family protein [unclassified Streptomyces]|uniref:UDP-glucose dehydrogenase family protein n=1 Tax=unclassified Streptomyces TaxID=2593676 RepID=UPI0036F51D58